MALSGRPGRYAGIDCPEILRACVKSIDGPGGDVFVAPAKAGAQMPPAG